MPAAARWPLCRGGFGRGRPTPGSASARRLACASAGFHAFAAQGPSMAPPRRPPAASMPPPRRPSRRQVGRPQNVAAATSTATRSHQHPVQAHRVKTRRRAARDQADGLRPQPHFLTGRPSDSESTAAAGRRLTHRRLGPSSGVRPEDDDETAAAQPIALATPTDCKSSIAGSNPAGAFGGEEWVSSVMNFGVVPRTLYAGGRSYGDVRPCFAWHPLCKVWIGSVSLRCAHSEVSLGA